MGWLREKGLQVRDEAPYVVRVTLHALGTDQTETFFGVPPIQSLIFPLALPELTFYRAVRQRGYTRLQMEISDQKTGEMVMETIPSEGAVFFNQYTFLLVFAFQRTDIVPPPLDPFLELQ